MNACHHHVTMEVHAWTVTPERMYSRLKRATRVCADLDTQVRTTILKRCPMRWKIIWCPLKFCSL